MKLNITRIVDRYRCLLVRNLKNATLHEFEWLMEYRWSDLRYPRNYYFEYIDNSIRSQVDRRGWTIIFYRCAIVPQLLAQTTLFLIRPFINYFGQFIVNSYANRHSNNIKFVHSYDKRRTKYSRIFLRSYNYALKISSAGNYFFSHLSSFSCHSSCQEWRSKTIFRRFYVRNNIRNRPIIGFLEKKIGAYYFFLKASLAI